MSTKPENLGPHGSRRVLRARYVFPVSAAPIADGVMAIDGERIALPASKAADVEAEDLGNVAILPGLINAHTHLEFSDLAAPLGEPGMSFVDWIRLVVEYRRRTGDEPSAIKQGLEESIRLGTTALGEIAQPGWPMGALQQSKLDATVFLELIAPTRQRIPQALLLAKEHLKAEMPTRTWRPGLSPHAPYSVHPDLLASMVALSAEHRVPLAIHLAESREELELLRSGRGPLRALLEERCQEPSPTAPDTSATARVPDTFVGARPLSYLHTLAAAHRALIIHGNYLDDEEIAFLAAHAQRMAVVYCPRTHAFFRHAAYPLDKMLSAGVTVALGTDSRASSPDLSVLAEMRLVAAKHPTVSGETLLKMATLHGAKALGLDQELGSLEPGKYADLTIVALPDHDAVDPYDLLLNSDLPAVATWRRGVQRMRMGSLRMGSQRQ